jgi:putative ABC transport system ATP-binding protein
MTENPSLTVADRRTAQAPEVLRVQGVVKELGGRRVLDGINLCLRQGERVALLGESGSGKSTLLNIISGLEAADAGCVQVNRQPIDGHDPDASALIRRSAIGFVFQAFHLLPYLDVARNVAIPLLLNGRSSRDAIEQAKAMLARLGLGSRTNALPRELSGGEQQRVALARALVTRPQLLLADEPTGNLDPRNADAALALIHEQAQIDQTALLLVTHSGSAAATAQRRLRLNAGVLDEV